MDEDKLPFRYNVIHESENICRIVGNKCHIASMVKREDAEFIVEACNGYAKLLSQLEEVRELMKLINLKLNEKAPKGLPSDKGINL